MYRSQRLLETTKNLSSYCIATMSLIYLPIIALVETCWQNDFFSLIAAYDQIMTNLFLDIEIYWLDDIGSNDVDYLYNYMKPYMNKTDYRFPFTFVCDQYLSQIINNETKYPTGIAWGRILDHWNCAAAQSYYNGNLQQNLHIFAHEIGHILHLGHSPEQCTNFMTSCNFLSNYNYTENDWLTIDQIIQQLV